MQLASRFPFARTKLDWIGPAPGHRALARLSNQPRFHRAARTWIETRRAGVNHDAPTTTGVVAKRTQRQVPVDRMAEPGEITPLVEQLESAYGTHERDELAPTSRAARSLAILHSAARPIFPMMRRRRARFRRRLDDRRPCCITPTLPHAACGIASRQASNIPQVKKKGSESLPSRYLYLFIFIPGSTPSNQNLNLKDEL